MELRVFGLVLLLVLSAALRAEAQTWEAFKNNHIIQHMDSDSCTEEIRARQINALPSCKDVNSFILAKDDVIKDICSKSDGKRVSNKKFNVVRCELHENNNGACVYTDENKMYVYIEVECKEKVPVHYVGEKKVNPFKARI